MSDDRPTFGSLFAGIGGIDLGLERAGWECRWQVEWDAYCQRVLAKHWPDVLRYGDITEVDWSTVEPVDLIAGGFPCQPFSLAGQRRGKSDDRWLWPAFAAAIRALRPRLVLVENVPGLLAGHGGMGSVLGDLAELGYDAAWGVISAADVGAPHLRRRVWVVAHPDGIEYQGGASAEWWAATTQLLADPIGHQLRDEPVALPWGIGEAEPRDDGTTEPLAHTDGGGWGTGFGDDDARQPGWWDVEPDVGRVAHGVPARVDRLRALGNAVVPQVVEVIGQQLREAMTP